MNGSRWFKELRKSRPHSRVPALADLPAPVPVKAAPTDIAKSRFIINVGSNVFYAIFNTTLMLWYVPFLIRHLGVAAYGMISLSHSLVAYAGIISASLDVSINRFLAIDLNQGNETGANRTFNTALALSLAACGILLLPAGVVTYYFPLLFNVPAWQELATQFLFAGVAVTMLSAIFSGSFGVASLITHRFDLRNVIRFLTSLSRVLVVVFCFRFWSPSLCHVAAGFIVSAWVGLVGDLLVWKLLTPQLHIDRHDIDRDRFHALKSLGGWAAVNQIGTLLLLQASLLIVNATFGAEMTGRYGSMLLFPALIEMMTATVITVLGPAIMACYAVGDIEGMRGIARRSVKLLGLGLALPIGLLCGFSRPLLTLWLGSEFAQLDLLLVLLIGPLTANLAIMPLAYVLTAYNRVKVQGLVTFIVGVASVALAIALARWSGWGTAGVAAATAIAMTFKNVVFLSSYSAVAMGLPWWTFFAPLIRGALSTLCIALAGRFISQLWWPTNWLTLGVLATIIAAAYCVAFIISLNRSDRDLLWSLLNRMPHG